MAVYKELGLWCREETEMEEEEEKQQKSKY